MTLATTKIWTEKCVPCFAVRGDRALVSIPLELLIEHSEISTQIKQSTQVLKNPCKNRDIKTNAYLVMLCANLQYVPYVHTKIRASRSIYKRG